MWQLLAQVTGDVIYLYNWRSHMKKRLVFSLIIVSFLTIPLVIHGADPLSAKEDLVLKINLTNDIVVFVKAAIWTFGIFIAILAFLGVAFFGFDIRKAKTGIQDSLKELREIIEQARELKKSIEETQKELIQIRENFTAKAKEAEKGNSVKS